MAGFDPVIFDLDGTVVDTVELIVESFRYATRTVLDDALPDEVILAGVGQPLMAQMRVLSAEHAQELYDVYREYNHRRHDELIRGYEGVAEVLDGLRAAGRRLGIVTSKSADTTQMAFRAVGLREHFEVVVTASDTTEHKPSPVPLRLCLERFGAPGRGGALRRRQPGGHRGRPRGRHGDRGRGLGGVRARGSDGLRARLLARRTRRAARPVPARRERCAGGGYHQRVSVAAAWRPAKGGCGERG